MFSGIGRLNWEWLLSHIGLDLKLDFNKIPVYSWFDLDKYMLPAPYNRIYSLLYSKVIARNIKNILNISYIDVQHFISCCMQLKLGLFWKLYFCNVFVVNLELDQIEMMEQCTYVYWNCYNTVSGLMMTFYVVYVDDLDLWPCDFYEVLW